MEEQKHSIEESMASLKKLLKTKDYILIPLALTGTDHFELNAKINGISGKFILDTGASHSCVGLDRADIFQLITQESEVKAAGAGAVGMETLISSGNKIQIGSWKKDRIEIVLFDLVHVNEALLSHKALPVDGIIGADVLKKGKAIIDYHKKSLYLKK